MDKPRYSDYDSLLLSAAVDAYLEARWLYLVGGGMHPACKAQYLSANRPAVWANIKAHRDNSTNGDDR